MEEEVILIQLTLQQEVLITITPDHHLAQEAQITRQREQIQQTHTTTLDQPEVTQQIATQNQDQPEVTLILKQQPLQGPIHLAQVELVLHHMAVEVTVVEVVAVQDLLVVEEDRNNESQNIYAILTSRIDIFLN